MKLFHGFLVALLLGFYFNAVEAAEEEPLNYGIAFVHGTSNHKEDAEGGYWKTDFIQRIASALPKPENYYIVHCDFSKYMWHADAANCVVDQLAQFITDKKITRLTLYTHSNGSNALRRLLSNSTYDSRYMMLSQKIDQVISIAPSSNGTPLADEVLNGGVFQTSVGWLLGYLSDAIKQQRVGDMLIYNEELLFGSKGRPSLPVPFKVIVGSDVQASPLSGSSYCNGYLLNAGLKLTQLYLDTCSDGFLNCSSQTAAGDVWFYDIDKTDNNLALSHNQSRHYCFGFDKLLISAFATEGATQ